MNWLEFQGLRSLRQQVKRMVRSAINEINHHITTELEKHMAPLNDSVSRILEAMTNEFDQIRAQAAENLAATQAALEAADNANVALNEALQGEVAKSQALVDDIDSATGRLDAASAELEANDPVVEPPVDPEVPVDEEPADPEVPVDPEVPAEA